MIDLTRCGAQETLSPMTAPAGSYERMLAHGAVYDASGAYPQETAQPSGEGIAPSAAVGSRMQGAVQGGGRPDESLGSLPAAVPGISSAEQLLHSSWKSLMVRNIGRSVLVSFLVGTRETVVARGILYEVGSDYIALYQPERHSYISADLYSIRFMEFLPEITQTNSRQQQQ